MSNNLVNLNPIPANLEPQTVNPTSQLGQPSASSLTPETLNTFQNMSLASNLSMYANPSISSNMSNMSNLSTLTNVGSQASLMNLDSSSNNSFTTFASTFAPNQDAQNQKPFQTAPQPFNPFIPNNLTASPQSSAPVSAPSISTNSQAFQQPQANFLSQFKLENKEPVPAPSAPASDFNTNTMVQSLVQQTISNHFLQQQQQQQVNLSNYFQQQQAHGHSHDGHSNDGHSHDHDHHGHSHDHHGHSH
jgi:hypothetical protein